MGTYSAPNGIDAAQQGLIQNLLKHFLVWITQAVSHFPSQAKKNPISIPGNPFSGPNSGLYMTVCSLEKRTTSEIDKKDNLVPMCFQLPLVSLLCSFSYLGKNEEQTTSNS